MSATITSGLSALAALDHRAAVLYHADEVEFGDEQAFQPLGNHPVIVGKQDAHAAHDGASRNWHPRNDGCASAGSALDIELSAQQANPLTHAGVTEARAMSLQVGLKSAAVVADCEPQTTIAQRER